MPFTKKVIDQTIGMFKMIVDKDYVSIILDKDGELAGFGLGFPSIARAMIKSKGRYLPFGIFRLLKAIKKPKYVELSLVAVHPKYQKMGVTAIIIKKMMNRIMANGIISCDTGGQLETNQKVINAFDMFERELVRKKVCFIKKLI